MGRRLGDAEEEKATLEKFGKTVRKSWREFCFSRCKWRFKRQPTRGANPAPESNWLKDVGHRRPIRASSVHLAGWPHWRRGAATIGLGPERSLPDAEREAWHVAERFVLIAVRGRHLFSGLFCLRRKITTAGLHLQAVLTYFDPQLMIGTVRFHIHR